MIVNSFNGQPYRRHQRLQTLFLLLELVTSEKNESFVSRTNALLVEYRDKTNTTLKADTHEGFCSWSMLQGHAPGAKLLRVYQRFHGYTSSSGAEFPPRKMLHDI